jgi:nitrous oxidase accessory protein
MIRLLCLFAVFITFLDANALQKAIDSAKVGSILKLKAGTYKGSIVIDKPLSIIGVEDGVIIDGEGNGTVIRVNSSYVTLKNLTVQGSGDRHDKLDAGIAIDDASQCEISDITIRDSLFGIDASKLNNSIIKNNYITSKEVDLGLRGDGLRLWYSNNNLIKGNSLIRSRDMVVWYSHGNVIEDNYGEHCRYSLHFMYAGKNYIRNNKYKFNSVGIFFMYSKDSVATGNIVKSSLGATGMGIGLKDVSNFTLKNNTVIYNAQGLYIDRSPFEPDENNWIEDNNILYNAEALHFHSISEDNIIKNNNIQGNIEDIVNDSRGSKTDENDFEGNYWDNYEGFDKDNNGIGDTPHRVYKYADQLWTYNPNVKFFYGSPVISMLNFLAKLAPFSEPVFLLEDAKPKVAMRK